LGHRRIGFVGGRPSLLSARQRREGYEAALREASLPIDPALYVEGDYSRSTALVGAEQLLNLPERPSAIMAANDQSALAVMDVAARLQLRIPHDLSVIGFDNTPESAYTSPPLTTVDQAIVTMGGRAAELLIQMVEGRQIANELYQLPTHLVVRGSCQRLAS
jgi:LacI family transcriptional regulator